MHKRLKRLKKIYLAEKAAKVEVLTRFRQYPVMLPVLTFLALGIFSASVFLLLNGGQPAFKPISSYIVIVSHDHQQQIVPTTQPTVGALLAKLNIKLNTGDVVEPNTTTPITQDEFRINVYRAVPVEIIDGSQQTYTFSAATTPRSVAQQAGITVYPQDYISTQPVSDIVAQNSIDKEIIIDPATPINLNIYGTPTAIRTHALTVGQLLSENNIKLGSSDTVQPDVAMPIAPNEEIFLLHHGTQVQNIVESIPTPVQTILDNSLTFGTSALRQSGSPGQQVLTYEETTVNGAVTSKTLIQTVVTVPAVPEIIAQGQAVQIPTDIEAVMAEAGIPSYDYPYVNYIVSNESGWCPTKLQGEVGYCPGYAPASLPGYLGYGLGQATPGGKMAPFGSDWETNPVTQLLWATSYANEKYGSWANAYNFWYNNHYW
jgi:uncharacterized protein YabE (DUF348 family)